MAKFLAELRVALKAGDEYSCHSFLQLKRNGEIYLGPCADLTSELLGRPAFRGTHHQSGATHLYLGPTGQRISEEQGTPTGKITGIEHLGASSSGLNRDWSYKPKKDTATRRTLVLDLEQITVPSFTVEAFAFAGEKPALWDKILARYSEKGAVALGHIRADWCEPNLALVVWSLTEAAWRNALHVKKK